MAENMKEDAFRVLGILFRNKTDDNALRELRELIEEAQNMASAGCGGTADGSIKEPLWQLLRIAESALGRFEDRLFDKIYSQILDEH